MTSAGKSYTMFGDIYNIDSPNAEKGLISHVIETIIEKTSTPPLSLEFEFKITLSYLEIYNEQVRDLLVTKSDNLLLIEDPDKGVIVTDLSEVEILDNNDMIKNILQGNQRR